MKLQSLIRGNCPLAKGSMQGKRDLDVSQNGELVELYVNDNCMPEIDLNGNPKLKYFYCHNNQITELDTRKNPLLRHLNATGNPMKVIRSLAPQREERLPLELRAGDGGTVGLRFNPVYNAQWKETGEWQQAYYCSPLLFPDLLLQKQKRCCYVSIKTSAQSSNIAKKYIALLKNASIIKI